MPDVLWGFLAGIAAGGLVTHLTWTLAHARKIRAALASIDSRLRALKL